MRSLPFLGLILTSVAFAQDATQGISSPQIKVQSFPALEQRVGGTWLARWNAATNTPSRIYGTGMVLPDWRENTIEEARRQAHNAIAKHSDLLQLGASEYREVIGSRMGRSWTFTFDQFFRDLPCIGGRVDVRINMKGVLAMLGSTAWQVPAGFDIVPAVSDLQAQANAWIALDQSPTGVPQPAAGKALNRLVIWGDVTAADAAPFYLAWEVPVSNVDANGNGPIRCYYIDAKTGDVLHWENVKHECGNPACRNPHHGIDRAALVGPPALPAPVVTTVTVMGFTRTGQSAISPVVNTPLKGLLVNVPGIGTRTTDNNGEFTIDIAAPVSINVTGLDGRHAALIADTFIGQPTASVTVTPGVPATLQFLTAAATQDQAAHTNTHYWVDEANEWARSILGNSAQLNQADAVLPTVNRTGNCNAFYTGNTINFYRQGSCNNSAFSTVIVHEWGHGLDDRYGGISQTQGLSEGWGDILGMYLVDNPVVGIDFSTGGMVRTGLNNTLYPPPAEVHAAGEVWMGFAWRLRENLRAAFGPAAITISNDIVVGSIAADATDQPGAVIEVFIADDDDGNLLNGVPHYAQLSAAATTKNLPFPVFQPVSLQHTALLDTTVRLTPRLVNTTALPNDAGTVTQVRLVFTAAGSPPVTRVMVPNGSPNGFRAMLPGLDTGLVSYHLEATSTTGVARFPATGELSYEVTAVGGPGPFLGFFSETFEGTAPGWTHVRVSGASTDDWQLGTPAGKSGTSLNVTWADPAVAGGGTRVYGNDLGAGTANGAYPANMNYYLRTPVINCSGRQGVTLRFKRWLTVEEGIFDRAIVSVNGIEVWSNPQNGHLRDTSWQTFEYALPAADNNPSVQIEWRLITDGGLQLGGWNIDDVEVGTRAVPALPATLRMIPEQSVAGGPMLLSIGTGGTGKLFVLIIGDTPGPTFVSPFPPAQVGGTLDFLVAFSDVAGLHNMLFTSFGGMPPGGLLLYTQVLVFEPGGTYTMSNQHLNLFTQ